MFARNSFRILASAGCCFKEQFRNLADGKSQKTCLYHFHVSRGGKMVDFAGYQLPIQYGREGISESHRHTRKHCSLFDVSHMLQTQVHGKDGMQFMEELCVADVQGLQLGQSTLSLFTNDRGGIIDDLIITKADEKHLYIVSNAGCKHKDVPLMEGKAAEMKGKGCDVGLEFADDRGLLAIQGPEAVKVVQGLTKFQLTRLPFMTSALALVAGIEDCRITRCGYTGEDGVEISVPGSKAADLADALLTSRDGNVKLAGLGARDSLRLEAGLCLYGNDIGEDTTPVEAALAWTIGKNRRQHGRDSFPGAEVNLKQLREKPKKKRVGLISHGPPARGHTPVVDLDSGKTVGEVTSGCPSPSLEGNFNVAMAYVPLTSSKIGSKVSLRVRNQMVNATVTKMPFVPSHYYVPK